MTSLDDLASRIYRQPGAPRVHIPRTGYEQPDLGASYGTWWWVFGQTELGKRTLLGAFASEGEAAAGSEGLLDVEFFQLDTRSKPRATSQIKAILLKRSKSPDDALTRHLHERGLEREKKRTGAR